MKNKAHIKRKHNNQSKPSLENTAMHMSIKDKKLPEHQVYL